MAGVFIAVLLIASLLLVHFSLRARPMPVDWPLDVDRGLPLPEVAQASTVFSLTALFGAYLGIYLLLGVPAVAGLACGTGLGLIVIRNWIVARRPRSFEDFLFGLLAGHRGNAAVFGLTIAATQCAYASSELVILRDIAREFLGVRPDHATILAVALGIIAYFYVLFGGYMAVFRTDVLQFLMVGAMVLICAAFAFPGSLATGVSLKLQPRPGYWESPFGWSGTWLYLYQFVIGSVMGFGLLAASPDAWKRVFLVAPTTTGTQRRFIIFLLIGIMPFLVLLPLGAVTAEFPDGPINPALMFSGVLANNVLFVAAALGLVASFLSAFDSAILASVHIGLMLQRRQAKVPVELPRFHWLMVAVLITTFFSFMALVASSTNPYLLANLLLGPYALIAGIQTGTWGRVSRLRDGSLLWIVVLCLVGWFLYFVANVDVRGPATTDQANTVPGGVGLFAFAVAICQLAMKGGQRRVRRP